MFTQPQVQNVININVVISLGNSEVPIDQVQG